MKTKWKVRQNRSRTRSRIENKIGSGTGSIGTQSMDKQYKEQNGEQGNAKAWRSRTEMSKLKS
jgi:hypothetical protein